MNTEHVRSKLGEELVTARHAEHAAWKALKQNLPGSGDYDPTFWEAWVAAVRRYDSARDAIVAHLLQPAVSR
jgi:hypothetical protein